jgi:hypothetical protein
MCGLYGNLSLGRRRMSAIIGPGRGGPQGPSLPGPNELPALGFAAQLPDGAAHLALRRRVGFGLECLLQHRQRLRVARVAQRPGDVASSQGRIFWP